MILRIEDIKSCCNDILMAVDSNELSTVTETLELIVLDNELRLNVTNREYYASVKLPLEENIQFHATVNALMFLKLISQTTTETVEFTLSDNSLIVKGNGTYKLPLIYDDKELLVLPKININNISAEFDICSDILQSILQYNSKQITSGIISRPIQKMYYVDEKGAITFTSGACINNFTLDQPIKLLFNSRLVKLFKLFKSGNVHFSIGHDALDNGFIRTKVKFETENIAITAILSCDDEMISSVPVTAIRSRAEDNYPYTCVLNSSALLESIKRITPFTVTDAVPYCYAVFEFSKDSLTIHDTDKNNHESIYYSNELAGLDNPYSAIFDLIDIKNVLEASSGQYLTFKFGNGQALAICRNQVINIIPEVSQE